MEKDINKMAIDVNSKNKRVTETNIRLISGDINSDHNDILVCPKCFAKWKLTERNLLFNVTFEGNKPPIVNIDNEFIQKYLMNVLLNDDIYCPDCNGDQSRLITMDSGIYETVKMFNQKGYPTIFSCSGGENGTPYIAFNLDLKQRGKMFNLIPGIRMNKRLVNPDFNPNYLEYTYNVNELPDGYEFMKDIKFNQWLDDGTMDVGLYSNNKCHIHAQDSFYKVALLVEDISKRRKRNEF